MAEPQIATENVNPKDQIIADVQTALKNKHWPQDLEHTAPYHQIVQALSANKAVDDAAVPAQQQAKMTPAEQEKIRGSDDYKRQVGEVVQMRNLSYSSSTDRANIIKIGGERDARDHLRDGYNALLKHMDDHPELAGQDAALLRNFQIVANGAAQKNHLTDDQRDNTLAGMLQAHAKGVAPERIAHMAENDQSHGPER